jgi:hypothetical protein
MDVVDLRRGCDRHEHTALGSTWLQPAQLCFHYTAISILVILLMTSYYIRILQLSITFMVAVWVEGDERQACDAHRRPDGSQRRSASIV